MSCCGSLDYRYSRSEAASHARLLHARCEAILGTPVFLDATDGVDLRDILTDGLHRSRALVLLQTAGVRHWLS